MHPDRLSFTTKNTLSPSLFLLAFVFGFFYSRMQYAPKEKPKKPDLDRDQEVKKRWKSPLTLGVCQNPVQV